VRRLPLLLLALTCCSSPTDPGVDYYAATCAKLGMTHLAGTRTCVGEGGEYVNLQPPRR
jgi:hypothetical protein